MASPSRVSAPLDNPPHVDQRDNYPDTDECSLDRFNELYREIDGYRHG
jgi:hypothetical protein